MLLWGAACGGSGEEAPEPRASKEPLALSLDALSTDWWMQAWVTAQPAPERVDVSVNGGEWKAMQRTSWNTRVWTHFQSLKGTGVRLRLVHATGTLVTCAVDYVPGVVLPTCAADGVYATAPTPPAPELPGGYLHTEGARLHTRDGREVRLTGLNWFGFEGPSRVPYGLDRRALGGLLDQVKAQGFNMLRLPYSNDVLREGVYPDTSNVSATLNPELRGLTSLQVLDRIVAAAKARGLRIVLDRHRPDISSQSELWYRTNRVSEEAAWIEDWKRLVRRYKGEPTVVGVDLHNEPHGRATWGDGNLDTDWRLAAERAGNAILAENPELLIIVEGIGLYAGQYYWWGGNLRGARDFPVRLSVPGRLVYSAHDYPESVSAEAWFQDKGRTGYPANLPAVWDAAWGYLVRENRAPVWVGSWAPGSRRSRTGSGSRPSRATWPSSAWASPSGPSTPTPGTPAACSRTTGPPSTPRSRRCSPPRSRRPSPERREAGED
ncbi:glycoside hydrolase family 5 protein [Melittangium boletus]|uniref:glycoside hydrolase family 5 protein n=1 Tax=Melittangium boletus TaxID=83453 RepID=UPI003DA4C0BF